MTSFSQIKREALENLRGKWGGFLLALILGVIIYSCLYAIGLVFLIIPGLIVITLEVYAFANLSLAVLDGEEVGLDHLFNFQGKAGRIFGSYLLLMIYVLLPMLPGILLFIFNEGSAFGIVLYIIGIIISIYLTYKYRYVVYIIRDTDLTASEAFRESSYLTDGNKFRIFLFELSFIGWCILVAVTIGLLGLYVYPYMMVSQANLYRTIVEEKKNL